MSSQTEQQMKMCPYDKKITLHYRNSESPNWALHIVLTLLTGVWLFVALYMALKGGKKGLWTCSECGTTQK